MKKEEKVIKEGTPSNRRNLLKALTAGGAAAAVVPAEWAKPLVKSVVLPAHAQATVTGQCGIPSAWFWATGTSMCMSAGSFTDESCGTSAVMTVYDDEGTPVGSCAQSASGSPVTSFSCSAWGQNPGVAEGDLVTFVVTFSNGCSCSVVRTAG